MTCELCPQFQLSLKANSEHKHHLNNRTNCASRMLFCKSTWQIFWGGILFFFFHILKEICAFRPPCSLFSISLTFNVLEFPLVIFAISLVLQIASYLTASFHFSTMSLYLNEASTPHWPGTKLRNKNRMNLHFQGLTPGSHKWGRTIHLFSPAAAQSERSCSGEGFDFCSSVPKETINFRRQQKC